MVTWYKITKKGKLFGFPFLDEIFLLEELTINLSF